MIRSLPPLLFAVLCCLQAGPSRAYARAPAADPVPRTVVLDHCSWDRPGMNPFMGELPAAVDRYPDIPPPVREKLKARMARLDYDDLVSIRRDSIDGRGGYDYGRTISDMHFGTHQVCRSVTRSAWTPQMQERGLVYCESGHCILVPTVCRNVSRITRSGVGPDAAAVAPLLPGDPTVAAAPPIDWFGPSGAGNPVPDAMPGALPTGGGLGEGGALSGEPAAPGLLPVGLAGIGGDAPDSAWTGGPGAGPFASGLPGGFVPAAPRPVVPAPIPEPQTWALLLLGLAAVGAARRARRVPRA